MVERAEIPARTSLREEVLAAFPPERRAGREAQQLARRIEAIVVADTVGARVRAWARLTDWTRPAVLAPSKEAHSSEPDTDRLREVVSLIESSPAVRAHVHASLSAMLAESESSTLFGEAGLPSHRGFFSEFGDRLMARLLPEPHEAHDLAGLLRRLFPSDAHLERFRRASGWATNISLGFLLGMTPAFGRFLGLPLDVRHVTLSTGMLALAAAAIDQNWIGEGLLLRAVAGIGVMFVLNLSVSFLLSLANAARAYDLPRRDVVDLLRRLVRRFVQSPGQFFLPPRDDAGSAAPAQA